ncbi:MAG: very short patch repair endonuclease [Bacteroidota bacterium]
MLKKYPEGHIVVPRFNEANGFYTTRQRSDLMAKIKSQDTKAELKLRNALWNLGYRYRKNLKSLPGKPDIVYPNKKLVIFVDGEFWHGYNWEQKKIRIRTNPKFWISKIERNIQRDEQINQLLSLSGWKVIRFWEHQLKKDFEGCLDKIIGYLVDNE